MTVSLLDYQKEAVKRALEQDNFLICMRAGGGKTFVAMFYARYLLRHKKCDKIIIACTVSAAVAVRGEFKEKLGIDLPQYDDLDGFLGFLGGSGKICVIKHSMFEKVGYDLSIQKYLKTLKKNGLKVGIIIDEGHKLQNAKGLEHMGFMNIRFLFDRILLMTATPYSSCLTQLYGIVHLIFPRLWSSLTAFKRDHVVEQQVKDKRGKIVRNEKIAYKNLKMLREKLKPFSFFHYPKIILKFFYHTVTLEDYSDYDAICKGVLTDAEARRVEDADNNSKTS